jgi:hypothetical protein
VAVKPESSEIYYYLGLIDFQKQENLSAAQKLLHGLRINPRNVKVD